MFSQRRIGVELFMKQGFVYKWTNIIDGRWYIGSHKGTKDDGYVGSGSEFKKAIARQGLSNFIREILYEGDQFRKEEMSILIKLDAMNDPQSYNMTNTGDVLNDEACQKISDALSGVPKSPEHREKIRQFMQTRTGAKNNFFGRKHNHATIQLISESMKGENGPCYGRTGESHPMFGKHHSIEASVKMSSAHKGKRLSPQHRESIKIGHQRRNEAKRALRTLIVKMVLTDRMSRKDVAHTLGVSINIVYGAIHRHNKSSNVS